MASMCRKFTMNEMMPAGRTGPMANLVPAGGGARSDVASTGTPVRFAGIRISIASPEKMMSWSYGEVRKPETINYRTLKPERDGLFCPRIFGPVKDYECLCGKYKRMKHKGVLCEKCQVEVIQSKVRRERMGHIELAAPVAHIWFLKAPPSSRMGLLLDMTLKDIESILYFERYVVLEPGITPLPKRALLTEEQYQQLQADYGADTFTVSIGAEAVRDLLAELDLHALRAEIRESLEATRSEMKRRKLAKRLRLVESFIRSKNRPEWMVLTVVPVIPPELRPLVPLDGGRFATSDLNDLYRRVINRNNRLKRLMQLRAPDIIIRNEKRMLQEAVDALFDNSRRRRPAKGANKRQLKSLSDIVTGKQGRFRQNLLGKRCDYSGRSVIVVGPELLLHQCGLPKKMALELFKPFIYSKLERYGHAAAIKNAKRMVELEVPEVWDILEQVIREHPVLLNRAPTLHRLGIQAFEPVLVEGKAIHLHPLVCTAFNADFDGDQMAVHVPLSVEAQLEARVLMMSTNNILSPANGKPVIVPTQDIVLGIYYLSLERDGVLGEGMAFAGLGEVRHALAVGVVDLHAKVRVRLVSTHSGESRVVETTPGRALLSELLPKHPEVSFDQVNRKLTKREVSELIGLVYRCCGQKETVIFTDRLMKLGFSEACSAGISFGKDDMIVPAEKEKLVDDAHGRVKLLERRYQAGALTALDRYNRIIDTWSKCTDGVEKAMMDRMEGTGRAGHVNSIYMMVDSGARGSVMQMKQLAGMRGLITNTSGEIIETPITSNFREGLETAEFFNSTHGSRKGLADTARKTSISGYFTRRLVDVAQDVIITEQDCGTRHGIEKTSVVRGSEVIETLGDRIEGRHAAGKIVHPETGEVLVKAGGHIGPEECRRIDAADLGTVRVRSVLTCETINGVCARCYGMDLARGTDVNVGEAVGVIAAQSIGEPGTQLTMRTFHIGGVAKSGSDQFGVDSTSDGTVHFRSTDGSEPKDVVAKAMVMTRGLELVVEGPNGQVQSRARVPYGAELKVEDGMAVTRGARLAEWDPYTRPILSEISGMVRFDDLRIGVSLVERMDESTRLPSLEVAQWQGVKQSQENLRPRVTVVGKARGTEEPEEQSYELQVGTVLVVKDEAAIEAGDVIARVQTEDRKSRDIVGGLPRVITLLDAPKPKKPAVLAEKDGTVQSIEEAAGRMRIAIAAKRDFATHLVPRDRYILVQEGDQVRKGDPLTDGNPVPHDILRIQGIDALAHHFVEEIQDVYRLEGVRINDKHIEVIVGQMLQKVQVQEPGDSEFLRGDEVDKRTFLEVNKEIRADGGKAATGVPVLQGITRASRETQSFISAASFQETTRALADAALAGKTDELRGLKENVIVGRLIPAGTGNSTATYALRAASRDRVVLEKQKERQSEQAARRLAAAGAMTPASGVPLPEVLPVTN